MLAQGWITHPQLQKALAAQRESGTGKIGEWLLSECGVEADQITRGLSMQWGCPVLTTEGFSPESMDTVGNQGGIVADDRDAFDQCLRRQ